VRADIDGGPRSIEIGERPSPVVAAPTDAVVRVVLGCVSSASIVRGRCAGVVTAQRRDMASRQWPQRTQVTSTGHS
jgi:hypothetical protein